MGVGGPAAVSEQPAPLGITAEDLRGAFEALLNEPSTDGRIELVALDSQTVAKQLGGLATNPRPDFFIIPSFGLSKIVVSPDTPHYSVPLWMNGTFADDFESKEAGETVEIHKGCTVVDDYFFVGSRVLSRQNIMSGGQWTSRELALRPVGIKAVYDRFTNPSNVPIDDFVREHWPKP